MSLRRSDAALAALLFCASAVLFVWWAVSDQLGGVGGDNAVYVLTARHYSPWLPPDPVAREFAEQSQYPPLYPLSLSLVADSLPSMHAVTALELALAVALLFAWSVSQGLSRWSALTLSALFAAMPGTYLEALQIHSESLYLALSLAALFALHAAQAKGPSARVLVAALAVTAAASTRTVGVSLLAPLFLVLWAQPFRIWLLAALAGAPLALWHLVHAPTHSYLHVLGASVGAAPWSSLGTRLVSGLPPIRHGWTENLSSGAQLWNAADVFLVAGLLAAARRAWRRQVDGLYVLSYLLIIAAWNFPAEATRFMWVMVPMMLAQLLLELGALAQQRLRGGAAMPTAAVLAVAALGILPSAVLAVQRAQHAISLGVPAARYVPEWYRPDPQLAEEDTVTYLSSMQALAGAQALVPAGECIFAIKPSVVALVTGRRSISPPAAEVPDDRFNQALSECRYVLMLAYRSSSYPEAMYPAQRLGDRWHEVMRHRAELASGATGDVAVLARFVGAPTQ